MPGAAATPAYRTSRAFLVRAAAMGEADRRLSFFTEGAGLVTAVAKSASRSRKRFGGGSLQKYFLLDIGWTEAPGRMGLLTQAAVVRSFWDLVADWDRVRHADHLLELAAALFPQSGPKPKAFAVLLGGFESLLAGEPPAAAARKVEAAFLRIGGWGPDLAACRRCGALEPGPFRFDPASGSLLCGDCPGGKGVPLSLGAVKTWRAMQNASPEALRRLRIPESLLKELQLVIPQYIEWHLGKPLRSLRGAAPAGKP